MSDEDFDPTQPYLAKELLRQAEAASKSRLDGLNKTKDRASSLLGWSLVTASAAIALSGKALAGEHTVSGFGAMVLAIGMIAVCFLCALVLMGTQIRPSWIYPVDLESMCKERRVTNEAELQVVIADELAIRDHDNFFVHTRKQRLLKWAWRASIATPLLSLLVAALFG
ncbi:hypothetical protein ABUE34_12790 [Kozakia baliensis]|uniref:hypothetical protein n=1 Tax=Kozakia baliensis TaxID=153496 RepID=UPI00345C30DE